MVETRAHIWTIALVMVLHGEPRPPTEIIIKSLRKSLTALGSPATSNTQIRHCFNHTCFSSPATTIVLYFQHDSPVHDHHPSRPVGVLHPFRLGREGHHGNHHPTLYDRVYDAGDRKHAADVRRAPSSWFVHILICLFSNFSHRGKKTFMDVVISTSGGQNALHGIIFFQLVIKVEI